MAGVYPCFAIGAILLLLLTEAVGVRIYTAGDPFLSVHFIFFSIEFFRGGKDKKKEGRSSYATILAFLQTLLRATDTLELVYVGAKTSSTRDDPMATAVRYGIQRSLLSPLLALFPKRDSEWTVSMPDTPRSSVLFSARLPLYRFIYLVLYFQWRYHSYEGRKGKWQKRK